MKPLFLLVIAILFVVNISFAGDTNKISQETMACLGCHEMVTPGIVKDWRSSSHSKIVVSDALKKPEVSRMVSNPMIDSRLSSVVVGCYECHGLNKQSHKDNF
ncbi:MAG: hydroxylamine oxidase, partial [Thermodesulfovibrionales bacterium]